MVEIGLIHLSPLLQPKRALTLKNEVYFLNSLFHSKVTIKPSIKNTSDD